MRWFKRSSDNPSIDWKTLTSEDQFTNLLSEKPMLAVFKHSTRCSISSMAMGRLEREWSAGIPLYIVDVIRDRALSNAIESRLGIPHQSPQLIIIQGGNVVYAASHNGINAAAALESIAVEEEE